MARSRRSLFLAFAAAVVAIACGPAPGYGPGGASPGVTPVPIPEAPAGTGPDWLARIDDVATFTRFAERPEYNASARTEIVKVIIDRRGDVPLYFLDSHRWNLHFYFVRDRIDRNVDHATFNISEYRRPDRRYVLATVVHYLDGDHYTFELVAGDTLDAEGILRSFQMVRDAVYFGDRLRFRPSSPLQEQHAATLGARLPTLRTDAVFANVRYQPLVVGEAYGFLRFVRGTLDVSALRPNDVVVTEDVPEELPPVSALVTSKLQAPLAHVAVLARNRSTPDMALRGAIDDPAFRALEGRLVHLRVSPQDFVLEAGDPALAEQSWRTRRPNRPVVPGQNLGESRIRDLCALGFRDTNTVGAKAAQLGEVCRLGGDVVTPGGFTVPFHDYDEHFRRSGARARIDTALADARFQADASVRGTVLAEVRAQIERASVDPALLSAVRGRLLARPTLRHIFRSSTNAEDLPGFNGAGLYESVVVSASASEQEVISALRRVWSSVWLQRAYEERSWYRIDHTHVAMGILIQPFVGDIAASGVAVTVNPFDEARPGMFINAQAPGASVTGAHGDQVPEQFLVYTWAEAPEPEIISRSSLTGGAPVLQPADLGRLVGILQRIHDRMMPSYGNRANGVDVEFMLTRDERAFVIVQARPFLVVYEPGQQYRYDQ